MMALSVSSKNEWIFWFQCRYCLPDREFTNQVDDSNVNCAHYVPTIIVKVQVEIPEEGEQLVSLRDKH